MAAINTQPAEDTTMPQIRLAIPTDAIAPLCRRWQVCELALFGSGSWQRLHRHGPAGHLVGISAKNELAIIETEGRDCCGSPGVLARVPAIGGTLRAVREGVGYADWAHDGERLAMSQARGCEYTDGQRIAPRCGMLRVSPVNDDIASGHVADHFQPAVAAGLHGAVAVAFYDRRRTCPDDPSVISNDVGRSNFCIDVSVQPYKDKGALTGAAVMGSNIRASTYTWDPQQPGLLVKADGTTQDLQTLGGLGQIACASHNDPCRNSFIGDYFGLAISGTNIYTLSVSSHYASNVLADDHTPLYYQQQVLGTISRSSLGI